MRHAAGGSDQFSLLGSENGELAPGAFFFFFWSPGVKYFLSPWGDGGERRKDVILGNREREMGG